jgi:CheY-like chemotaxis protein
MMDIRMPELDGISALRQITAEPELAGVRVIMLTTFELRRVRLRCPAGRRGRDS